MLKRGYGKRASGHLEMLFAFVFFVGFVFFLLYTIRPYEEEVLPDSIVKGIAYSIQEDYSTNLTSFYLKVNYSGINFPAGQQYFVIQFPTQKLLEFDIGASEVIVKKAITEEKVTAEFENPSTKLKIAKGVEDFRVMFSGEFPNAANINNAIDIGDQYELGNLIERKVISYSKLLEMNSKYSSDYEGLKTALGVPQVYDFAIIFPEFNEMKMNKEPPLSVDALSQTFVYEVLKSDGSLINAQFNIVVW